MRKAPASWVERTEQMLAATRRLEECAGLPQGSIELDWSGNPVLQSFEVVEKLLAKIDHAEPVDRQELARRLGKSYGYVSAAVRFGFPMPGGLASVDEFREWHAANPTFTKRAAEKCQRDKMGQTARRKPCQNHGRG